MANLDFSDRGVPVPDPRPNPRRAGAPAPTPTLDFSSRGVLASSQKPPAPDFSGRGTLVSDRPSVGMLGSWGTLTPVEGRNAAEAAIPAAEAALADAIERRDRLKSGPPQGVVFTPDEQIRFDGAIKAAEQEIVDATKTLEIERGRAAGILPGLTTTPLRNFVDNAIFSLTKMAPDTLKAVGIAASTLPGAVEENIMVGAADEAEKWLKQSFPGDPQRDAEFLTTLAQGTGSMAGFMIGGIAGRAVGVAAGMSPRAAQLTSTMGLGAAQGGVAGYEDAQRMGATALQRYLSFFLNAGIGTSEAIPIDRLFYRMNQAAGGRLTSMLANSAAQSFEEFAQEFGQQVGADQVAKYFAGYDPARELGISEALEQGLVGAILGGITGGAAGVAKAPAQPQPQPQPAPVAGEPALDGVPEGAVPAETLIPAPPAETDEADAALLRGAGWSDEQIADMADEERAAAVEEARAQGATPAAAAAPSPATPAPAAAHAAPASPAAAPAPTTIDERTDAYRKELEAAGVSGVALEKLVTAFRTTISREAPDAAPNDALPTPGAGADAGPAAAAGGGVEATPEGSEAGATVPGEGGPDQATSVGAPLDASGTADGGITPAVVAFRTAKGSTYTVNEDGGTTRIKAARSDPGHEGDFGLKDPSAKTVYLDPKAIQALAPPSSAKWRLVDMGDGTFSLATLRPDGQWGVSPSARNIKASTKPAVGLAPLEMWEPETVNGRPAYGKIHPGNPIVEITDAAAGAQGPQPEAASPPAPSAVEVPAAAPLGDGSRAAPVAVTKPQDVAIAESRVDTAPTDAMKEAGNYRKAHISLHGLDITIENPKGSIRSGKSAAGEPWSVAVPATYGYIKGSEGADGDHVDVYVGDKPDADRVYVVDQKDLETNRFDEHKALIGFASRQAAIQTYRAGFSDGKGGKRIGGVKEMSVDEFKAWLKEGDMTAPVAMSWQVSLQPRPQRKRKPGRAAAGQPPAAVATAPETPTPTAIAAAEPAARPAAPAASPARKPARRQAERPVSLVAFLKGIGGIREESGELAAMNLHRRFPGLVNNAKGKTHDYAREAAAEAGYFDHIYGTRERAVAESTPADLRALLADGDQAYPAADEEMVAERKAKSRREIDRERHAAAVEEIVDFERANGLRTDDLELNERAAYHLSKMEPAEALERAAIELEEDASFDDPDTVLDEGVPFPEGAERGGLPEGRGSPERAGEAEAVARDGDQAAREPVPDDRALEGPQRLGSIVERTSAGQQTVLPGAERISDAELARRKAGQPLKPQAPQKPADEGLFGDDSRQTDLIDLARKDGQSLGSTAAPPPGGVSVSRLRIEAGRRQVLERALSAIVRRIAGKDVSISFEDRIAAAGAGDAAYQADMARFEKEGGSLSETAGGEARIYSNGEALVRLALADPLFDPTSSAYHEAYHVAEATLMTDAEFAAVRDGPDMPMIELAARQLGIRVSDAALLPAYEIRAIAFERYARARDGGASVAEAFVAPSSALSRFFERLRRLLAEVKRLLGRQGITRVEDIFEAVYRGDMASRPKIYRDLTSAEAALFGAGAEARVGTVKVGGNAYGAIRVYHGTPHDFDKFELSHKTIGTGEGAQAYGHGLYFAENEGVAKNYRDALSGGDMTVGGVPYNSSDPVHAAAVTLSQYQSKEEAIRDLSRKISEGRKIVGNEDNVKYNIRMLSLIKERDDLPDVKLASTGRVYEASLNAHPDDFLDWDKPLSEQSAKVREILEGMGIDTKPQRVWTVKQTPKGWTVYDNWGQAAGTFKDEAAARSKASAATSKSDEFGGMLAYSRLGGNPIYSQLDKGNASERLRAAGIKGIRYKDAGSRTKEGGTSNYVVFDDSIIEITAKDGRPVIPPKAQSLGSVVPHSGPIPGTFIGDRVDRFRSRARAITDPARVYIQDRYLAVKRLQEAVEANTGVRLTTPLDAYQAIRLYVGRAGERLVDLQKHHVEPLIEDMRAREVDGAELDEYLYARHAPERNAEMAKVNPDIGDAGSGMSNERATEIIDKIKKDGRIDDFKALAERVDRIVAATRAELVRAGLIDTKTSLLWKTTYPNYVPLRGFDDLAAGVDEHGVGQPRTGRGFDVRGPESHRALGRASKADSPLAYVVMQAEQAIVRAEKNRTLKTVLRFAQEPAMARSGLFKVDRAEMKRRVNPTTGVVETYAVPPQFSKAENLFAVKIGGKTHWIEINHAGYARALRGVGSSVDNAIVRGLLRISHTYAAMLTQWNPEFVPTNAVRDIQTALVNVSEFSALAKGTRTRILKDAFTLKSVRGAVAAMYDLDSANPMKRWYDEYRLAGGKVSFVERNDVDAIKRRINALLKAGDIRRGLGALADLVGNLNTAVENGVRLSVYANLRENGVEQDRAAMIARDLTTDFNLRGEWSPVINALYIFFNASLQGSIRLARAVAMSKTARIAVASIFSAGFAMEFLNAMIAGGGDDDRNPYDEIPDYERTRNMIVMLPGGDHISFPLAYGYNVPFLAGQQLAAMLRGKRTAGEAALTTSGAAIDAFNPLGTVGSIGQLVAPWFVDPFIQSSENRNFFGGPIMPTVYDEKKPLSETYFKSAPTWAKAMARWLNETTGGNVGRPGLIDVSPETIQHFAEFAGGGIGRFMVNSITTAERMLGAEEWLPEDTPVVRRFYSRTDTGAATERNYFDAWAKIDQAHYEQAQLEKAGDIETKTAAAATYRAEIAAYAAFKLAEKKRAQFKKQTLAAERIEDEARRRERLAAIDADEKAAMEKALDAYAKALAKADAAGD